jgi:lipoate-protein ligase A
MDFDSSFPRADWRLIKNKPASGAWNMAVDEAILINVIKGESPPTLRLYAWDPPSVSLGVAQSSKDIDQHKIKMKGWDIVRRPTGGRALLHTDEITYAGITKMDDPRVAGGVLESYLRLSKALLSALQMLHLPAVAHEVEEQTSRSNDPVSPVCFEMPSNYEITVSGKKLIGSAQVRRQNSVLQHGSLPLIGDITRLITVLDYDREVDRKAAYDRLVSWSTTVESVLDRQVSWDEAADAFQWGFASALNISFQIGVLTDEEIRNAKQLFIEKYANQDWTFRK